MKNFEEYQSVTEAYLIRSFGCGMDAMTLYTLGLTSESGEVADKLKKIIIIRNYLTDQDKR